MGFKHSSLRSKTSVGHEGQPKGQGIGIGHQVGLGAKAITSHKGRAIHPMTSKSAPVAGNTGGGVKQGHTEMRSQGGAGHSGQPGGKSIGIGSSNPSIGMADHHGPGRSGLTGAAHGFRGMNKSPTCGEYNHGGHRIGKK